MTQAFINNGLVGEYIRAIPPVMIGRGKAPFGGLARLPELDFLGSRRFGSGAVAVHYKINGET
jgi:hypothetical protein